MEASEEEYLIPFKLMYDPLIKKINGYTIFCDESMNYRKVRLKETIKNELKYKFFVIGGVEVPNNCILDKIKDIFKEDDFPEFEAKYKYFSNNKTDFAKALSSKRLNKLFRFMLDNNILIHINITNYWYWAISDIVHSVVDPNDVLSIQDSRCKISAMYESLMCKYDDMFNVFLKYDFPNIKRGHEKLFIFEILQIMKQSFEKYYKVGDELYTEIKSLIEYIDNRMQCIDELLFIQDEISLEIVTTLVNSYLQTAYMFKENGIVFDMEEKIVEEINSISPNILHTLNCSFVDSKTELGIQLSDVVVGFTSRFLEFVCDQNKVSMFYDTLKTGSTSFDNCYLFSKIFATSCDKYIFNYVRTFSIRMHK